MKALDEPDRIDEGIDLCKRCMEHNPENVATVFEGAVFQAV